jgi:hypothetical protein
MRWIRQAAQQIKRDIAFDLRSLSELQPLPQYATTTWGLIRAYAFAAVVCLAAFGLARWLLIITGLL